MQQFPSTYTQVTNNGYKYIKFSLEIFKASLIFIFSRVLTFITAKNNPMTLTHIEINLFTILSSFYYLCRNSV